MARDFTRVPPGHLLAEHAFWFGVWFDPGRRPSLGVPVMTLLSDIEREMARRLVEGGNVFRIALTIFRLTHKTV